MSIEGEERYVRAKEICNMFKKTIKENFQNFKKELPVQIQEDPKH
jgi:hypothetical protein